MEEKVKKKIGQMKWILKLKDGKELQKKIMIHQKIN